MSELAETLEWIAVDTETTGLNPWKNEIIEIGAVKFNLTGMSHEFSALIKPSGKIDPRSRAIHNISNEELEQNALPVAQVLEDFFHFVGEQSLVFHNAAFDISFIKRASEEIGLAMPNCKYFDSLVMSRKLFPNRNSHSLAALKEDYQIDSGPGHRALSDAKATAQVFSTIISSKPEWLQSKKKFERISKFQRKLQKFQILFPKNYEQVEAYFASKIRAGQLIKAQFYDKEGRNLLRFIKPLELMVFNQNMYIKSISHPEKTERMVPIRDAIFFDQDLGQVVFQRSELYSED